MPLSTIPEVIDRAERNSAELGARVAAAQEYTERRLAQADEEGKQLLAKTQIRGGAQKLSPSSMKGSALLGRNSNLDVKRKFKQGAVARIDPEGGSTRAGKKKR